MSNGSLLGENPTDAEIEAAVDAIAAPPPSCLPVAQLERWHAAARVAALTALYYDRDDEASARSFALVAAGSLFRSDIPTR